MSQRQLLKEFINTSWPNGHLQAGQNRIQFLLERSNQIGENTQTVPAKSREEAEDASGSNTFALEEQLRDFLAENLQLLEVGLQQWPTENGDAVEYPVENRPASRRVDILARDAKGLPVIIELKVSRGHERTIGQALYYRAKIKERLNQPDARIFIVANLISPELRAAASEIVGVKLFQ
jgi:RecB family endonuclease NucS